MASINYTNKNIDQTVRLFDAFYEVDVNVPAAEYDIVNSYFKTQMTDPVAADNFTSSLFLVSGSTGTPVLTLLQAFENGGANMSLNLTMAYYLNQIRSAATLLGIGVAYAPNVYAARNVLQ